MANTAVVTKVNVNKIGEGLFSASVKMVVNNGTTDIFESTANAKYNANAPDLDAVKKDLLTQLKTAWDKYKAENNIFSAVVFDTMVSDIQTQANTYVNNV